MLLGGDNSLLGLEQCFSNFFYRVPLSQHKTCICTVWYWKY